MNPCIYMIIALFLKQVLPTNLFSYILLQFCYSTHVHTTQTHNAHANIRSICIYKQREREAREARQLDREIRAQERHYQAETKKKEAAELHKQHHIDKTSQVHQTPHSSQQPIQKSLSTERGTSSTPPPNRTPRDSLERTTTDGKLRLPSIDKDKLGTTSAQYSTTPTTSEAIKIDSVKVIQANYRYSPTIHKQNM